MSPTNTPNDIADSKTSASKKGYSIWSLLVIMTLLAVLLAIPKPKLADFDPMTRIFLVGCHQVALWILFGTLLWMLLGKRRSVLILESIVVVVIWGPLFGALAEDVLGGKGSHPIVTSLLTRIRSHFRDSASVDETSRVLNSWQATIKCVAHQPGLVWSSTRLPVYGP